LLLQLSDHIITTARKPKAEQTTSTIL